LDRGTEGLILAAKNYAALRDMNEIIRTDLLLKTYYCITSGIPKKGRFKAYLKHFEKDNKVVIKPFAQNGYKEIITDIDVINAKSPLALCKIGLITGRTHQIRAHLAFLGTPVLGDIKYGSIKMNERYKMKAQCLCAVSVEFKNIPPENVLHYLQNKKIELIEPEILKVFNNL
ncbi:MAG: RNA pseudouridine synthase, partial [Oscillospiraceae bacterium]